MRPPRKFVDKSCGHGAWTECVQNWLSEGNNGSNYIATTKASWWDLAGRRGDVVVLELEYLNWIESLIGIGIKTSDVKLPKIPLIRGRKEQYNANFLKRTWWKLFSKSWGTPCLREKYGQKARGNLTKFSPHKKKLGGIERTKVREGQW